MPLTFLEELVRLVVVMSLYKCMYIPCGEPHLGGPRALSGGSGPLLYVSVSHARNVLLCFTPFRLAIFRSYTSSILRVRLLS